MVALLLYNPSPYRYWLANGCTAPGIFTRFNINLATRDISYEVLDPASNEFPGSHPYRHGKNLNYS